MNQKSFRPLTNEACLLSSAMTCQILSKF